MLYTSNPASELWIVSGVQTRKASNNSESRLDFNINLLKGPQVQSVL